MRGPVLLLLLTAMASGCADSIGGDASIASQDLDGDAVAPSETARPEAKATAKPVETPIEAQGRAAVGACPGYAPCAMAAGEGAVIPLEFPGSPLALAVTLEWRGEGAAAAQGEARLLVDGQRNATHAYGKSPLELQWDLAGLAGHDLAIEVSGPLYVVGNLAVGIPWEFELRGTLTSAA